MLQSTLCRGAAGNPRFPRLLPGTLGPGLSHGWPPTGLAKAARGLLRTQQPAAMQCGAVARVPFRFEVHAEVT